MLGVSTQVVGTYIYVTNGRYNVYKYGNITITFKRVANKEIFGISKDTAMLGQAIKALGKGNVSQKDLRILRRKFSDETKQKILLEGKQLTAWIYDYIKEICSEE